MHKNIKIIVSDYFKKLFKKKCKNIELSYFIKKLNLNKDKLIFLKTPFFKIKVKLNNKSYRLIIFSSEDLLQVLLINIFDKKDKKFGENIRWNLCEKEIIKFYKNNLSDIENKDYSVY